MRSCQSLKKRKKQKFRERNKNHPISELDSKGKKGNNLSSGSSSM